MKQPPPGWGLNSLSSFFDMARENQFATFYNDALAKDLASIDHILWTLLSDNVDPKPMFPMQFLLRGHSCFRAASSCAMAGQIYEATVLERAALESAAYGLHLGPDEELAITWLSRHNSKSATERVRKDFSFGEMRRHFEADYPSLAASFVTLYELAVDFGAHPNESGFSINTDIRQGDKQKFIDTIYLHGAGLPLRFGLKNVARVGIWIVLTFRELYSTIYASKNVEATVQQLTSRH